MSSTFRPLVSIIIPAYNVCEYIEKCILSAVRQTYSSIEIVVVDDGSLDDTSIIVDRLAAQDSRIISIHQNNSGVSAARNMGISKSKGEYLVFLDGDDYLAPDFVEYMLKLVEVTGGDLCFSLDSYTKENEKQVKCETIETLDPVSATALLLSPRVIVGCWNKIYKRSVLDSANLRFPTHLFYGEGLFFYISYSQLCVKIGVGNRKVYYYRRNNYNSATTKFKIESFINGYLSIDLIRKSLVLNDPLVNLMIDLHQCLFCMGAIVRIFESGMKNKYLAQYNMFSNYLHGNILRLLINRNVPFYRKLLLLGTCISPSIMANLDLLRRKYIVNNSVK